jgi:hypothetical protein
MRIKCGRFDYELISSDVILDNGAVIWVRGRINLNCSDLKIARGTFNKLLKEGKLEFIKNESGMVKGGVNYYRIKENTDGQS